MLHTSWICTSEQKSSNLITVSLLSRIPPTAALLQVCAVIVSNAFLELSQGGLDDGGDSKESETEREAKVPDGGTYAAKVRLRLEAVWSYTRACLVSAAGATSGMTSGPPC